MLITDKERLKDFYASNRLWQGIPGIEITKGDRMFCSFFSGATGETVSNYSLVLQSDDRGKTWSEPVVAAFQEGAVRCFDPCLWVSPDDKLWFFWGVQYVDRVGKPWETYASYTEHPDSDSFNWCEPFLIGEGMMVNKPVVLSDNSVYFYFSDWRLQTERTITVLRSKDNGITRKQIGKIICPKMVFGEMHLIERQDGSLAMYYRAEYGIGKAVSYDGGHIWAQGARSNLDGPCSRFYLGRLKSGKLLCVNHYHFQGRNNLTAMLSDDDGESWYGHLLLDERDQVSYPDVAQASDDRIYIIYDHNRGSGKRTLKEVLSDDRELLLACLTEEDITAGHLVHKDSYLKGIVNRLASYQGKNSNPYHEPYLGTDEEYTSELLKLTPKQALKRMFTDFSIQLTSVPNEKREKIDALFTQLSAMREEECLSVCAMVIEPLVSMLKSIPIEKRETMPDFHKCILEYINQNYTSECDMGHMADVLHTSAVYMKYFFKQRSGITINRYINYRRICLAQQLLDKQNDTLHSVASKTGFKDVKVLQQWFQVLSE